MPISLLAPAAACALSVCGAGIVIGASASVAAGAQVKSHAPRRAGVAASHGTRGLEQAEVTVDGLARTYLIYVPPGDSVKHRLPLVIAYSGAETTAEETVPQTGLLTLAERRHDMIVVFPQGYDDTWNDDAGNPPAEAANINDLGFTRALLRRIESNYYVDMTHVIATGISNGGILTELLGCRLASYLTMVVPVEGQIATTFSSNCKPGRPISVYEIHATADPTIPYDGGTFVGDGGPVSVISAPASAARWAHLDKCSARAAKVKSSRGGSSILTEYKGCNDGVGVTLESIQGGSHSFPSDFSTTIAAVVAGQTGKRQAVKP